MSEVISDGCLSPGSEADVFFTLLWSGRSQSQVFSVIIHSQGRTMNFLLGMSQQKVSVALFYLYSLKCSITVRCLSPLRLGRETCLLPASLDTHSSNDRHSLVGETSEKPGILRKQSPEKLTFCRRIFACFLENNKTWTHPGTEYSYKISVFVIST